MAKINGGIIGPNNPTGPFSAGGVWRLEDAFNAQKAGTWPLVLGYQIPNSTRFNSGSSDYLSRTPAGTSSGTITTHSLWFKRSDFDSDFLYINYENGVNYGYIGFDSDSLDIRSSPGYVYVTTQKLRDPSAWYHLVVAVDNSNATAGDRVKIYLNGSRITSFSTQTDPTLNAVNNLSVDNTASNLMNVGGYSGGNIFGGYISEFNFIDGQALTPSSFGQTDSATGIWTPLPYTGTYGTNGFFLKFQDSSALGDDTSGNGNDFTANNLTSIDQSYDSPTNNFATLNPLVNYQAYPPVLTEGNLKNTSNANASNGGTSPSTIVVSQGKWYAEMKVGANKQDGTALGIVTDSYRFDYQNDAAFYTSASFSSVAYLGDGRKVISNTFSSYGATFTANDIIGIAVDLDNDTVTFYKNGVSQGVISTTLTGGYFICCYGYNSSVQEINFGYPPFTISSGNADANGFGNFEYAVPSGYYSLCSKNLALYG
jgi:hypothetical protein